MTPNYLQHDANKYLRELGLGYDEIHVCENNCVLFRKTYANMDACPKCKQSRWEDKDGKRVPRKVLRHFPPNSKVEEDVRFKPNS